MDKDFVLICKVATEYIIENQTISKKKCDELFGSRGLEVFEQLRILRIGKKIGNNTLCVTKEAKRLIDIKYFDNLIAEIKKKEYDRNLSNKSKEATIKSTLIAKIALILSILSFTGLPQILFKWLYSLIFKTV